MKDAGLFLQQAGLKSLGFDPGPLDGIPGARTAAARAAWEASLTPATAGSIAHRLVELAKADLWIRETEGKNQGDGIAKYWPATTYPDGYQDRQPYCAAAVCYWVREAVAKAAVPFTLPTTAKAFLLEQWAKRNAGKGVVFIGKGDQLEPGDIIIWEFSHASVVEARCPRGSGVVQTIDANTSLDSGNNEGGGVFRRSRSRTLIRSVIRITP
jgi:hypothetical protein